MTPERWQQISQIFKGAISLDGEARNVYVAEKCGADESLRSDVEKLIEAHQQASEENFIGGHAAEKGVALIIDPDDVEPSPSRLAEGQQLGSYVVLKRLGAGGMGEVYLARDLRLDRTVALKVLSADVSSDRRRMQRFRQEARVASSLNQPNILTIFESGEVDGLTFLATEFVDGETLRDYLHNKRLKLPEILDIIIQVLAALDAAHEARIVHRDIKPENVMIRRRDHVVKVLDFGLAKVTEKRSAVATNQSELEAATAMMTAPGTLMGTINYMSPEQAQSQSLDGRTDIWSSGVILYEMLTGVMPFSGPTTGHTLVQIIDKQPAPLPKSAAAPAELQRILSKAMAKSPEDRYQTAKDMLIDLKSLRKQLDNGSMAAADTDVDVKKRLVVLIALVVVAVVTAAIFAVNVWRAQREQPAAGVSTVTTTTPAVTPAASLPQRTLTYWITVQQERNGQQKTYNVRSEINFEQSDLIRLNVRSAQAGYLYVLNEGPRDGSGMPEYNVVFPSPTANQGSSRLTPDQVFQIPDETWLRFDKEQGVERLWLVFAEESIPEFEALKKFANRKTHGAITDVGTNKFVQDFISTHFNSKPDVEKSETLTSVRMPGKVLLYPVPLEHH